jgi:hypothetical protein
MTTEPLVCKCGIDEGDRCGECGGCDCPDNPGTCDGPGCIGADELEQMRDESGYYVDGDYGW